MDKMKNGYTTGTCAAAASYAAAAYLLLGKCPESVTIKTSKETFDINIAENEKGDNYAVCAVRKYSGDDPDVTNGMLIFAKVIKDENQGSGEILIDGGEGIGTVTKPGLEIEVGKKAINPVPRKMIKEQIESVLEIADYKGGLRVIIFAPGGDEIAKKTFNERFGIVGGISIIGTTGVVEPMSDDAIIETTRRELKIRKAQGFERIILVPGNYGADFIKESLGIEPEYAVIMSNYIGEAIDNCISEGFKGALIVGHIGKLVKLGAGMFNTHSKYGDARMEILTSAAAVSGAKSDTLKKMMDNVSCDGAIIALKEEGSAIYESSMEILKNKVVRNLEQRTKNETEIGIIAFSKVHGVIFKSDNADELISKIRKNIP